MLLHILLVVLFCSFAASECSKKSHMATLLGSGFDYVLPESQGSRGLSNLKAINSTCFLYTECNDCTDISYVNTDDQSITCIWCSDKSLCVSANSADNYCSPSDQMRSCDANYYTIIFIVVLCALFCLCCCTCYMKRYRMRGDVHSDFLSPILPSAARALLWRRSFAENGVKDWMCIICGFDNKNNNDNCSMCGTTHDFSVKYKTEKKREEKERREKERAKAAFQQFEKLSYNQQNNETPIEGSGGTANIAIAGTYSEEDIFRDNAGTLPSNGSNDDEVDDSDMTNPVLGSISPRNSMEERESRISTLGATVIDSLQVREYRNFRESKPCTISVLSIA